MFTVYVVVISLALTAWILVVSWLTRTPALRDQYGTTLGKLGTVLGGTFGLLGLTLGLWYGLA